MLYVTSIANTKRNIDYKSLCWRNKKLFCRTRDYATVTHSN